MEVGIDMAAIINAAHGVIVYLPSIAVMMH
jgi:hypothetical protein